MKIWHCDAAYAVAMRRRLHQHPELSMKEYETAKLIREELTAAGIDWEAVGETGTLGRISGGPGPKILLRADIDALPIKEETDLPYKSVNDGVMHACGHDMHTAALLAAAKKLAGLKAEIKGTVLLAFQPAEEMGHGSQLFEERGLTQGYDRAFGVHIAPDVPAGSIAISRGADAASCDYYKLSLQGVSSHTARPHQGKNALLAGAAIVQQIAQLRAEIIDPAQRAVIGVGRFDAGEAYNIVASHATIEGSFRAFSAEARLKMKEQLEHIAAAAETVYGVKAKLETECFAPAVVNAAAAVEELTAVAKEVLGADKIRISDEPVFGFAADDFSVFMQHCPGVYGHVGVAREGVPRSSRAIHMADFEPDEEGLAVAADLHINYALAFLAK